MPEARRKKVVRVERAHVACAPGFPETEPGSTEDGTEATGSEIEH